MKRYVSVWFRYLMTDRHVRRHPSMKDEAFVMAASRHGRMVVTASNYVSESMGIEEGMVVADARAVFPSLHVIEDSGIVPEKLLGALAEWMIRFTPVVSVDPPDGLMLDATGCTHLWKGEQAYLRDIFVKVKSLGYTIRLGMAGTPGAAWAMARYGKERVLVEPGGDKEALSGLPPAALRLSSETVEKLHKLGLSPVSRFIDMPASVLRRRFGAGLPYRLGQVLGFLPEPVVSVVPITLYHERLPSLEPVCTATGIAYAINKLLMMLCRRLAEENKGLQKAVLKTFRVDGKIQEVEIGTHSPTCHVTHLFKLFELKISTIEPDLGIELFTMEAPVVVEMPPVQEHLWSLTGNREEAAVAELLDRLTGRGGAGILHRYLPEAHHWPERSVREARSLEEKPQISWKMDRPRPVHLLSRPDPIEVTAPIPDYPPMLFRYRGELFTISKADGPERIEQEWWISDGLHRDYYVVEDSNGARYWIFRLGHYAEDRPKWFIHGFFA